MTKHTALLALVFAGCSSTGGAGNTLPGDGATAADMTTEDGIIKGKPLPDLLGATGDDGGASADLAQAQSTDMAGAPRADLSQVPAPDLSTPPDMVPAQPTDPGGSCTASSQCVCYMNQSSSSTNCGGGGPYPAYGYCVADHGPSGPMGNYCVTEYWTSQNPHPAAYNGYWNVRFGDQSHVLPGYPPPGANFIYGCSQTYNSPTWPAAPIPVGQQICYNGNNTYLVVLP